MAAQDVVWTVKILSGEPLQKQKTRLIRGAEERQILSRRAEFRPKGPLWVFQPYLMGQIIWKEPSRVCE